jgi:serine/threonine protein kinase
MLEYCENGTLFSYVRSIKSVEEKVFFLQQAMKDSFEALHDLHKANIIHRDIKEVNILVNKEKRIRLTDFGVSTRRPNPHTQAGTNKYQAPEMLTYRYTADIDFFSLGVTFYNLVF